MKLRVLAIAVIILALSVIRVLFPGSFAIAEHALAPVVKYGQSLADGVLDVGKRLSGNKGAVYAWEKEPDPPETKVGAVSPEGFDLNEMIHDNLSGVSGYANAFIPPETSSVGDGVLDAPTDDPPDEAAVTATAINTLQSQIDDFLAFQAAMTILALPDTICTEPVVLDFEYAAPSNVGYTSAFGYRVHPIYGDMRFHYGTDFVAYSGEPISAFADGTVIAAQTFDGYGLTVIIDHGNGFTSLYAHCSTLSVTFGDTVTMGQTIALVGQTGNVTGPHLHFELQKDGKYLNPEFYL